MTTQSATELSLYGPVTSITLDGKELVAPKKLTAAKKKKPAPPSLTAQLKAAKAEIKRLQPLVTTPPNLRQPLEFLQALRTIPSDSYDSATTALIDRLRLRLSGMVPA